MQTDEKRLIQVLEEYSLNVDLLEELLALIDKWENNSGDLSGEDILHFWHTKFAFPENKEYETEEEEFYIADIGYFEEE